MLRGPRPLSQEGEERAPRDAGPEGSEHVLHPRAPPSGLQIARCGDRLSGGRKGCSEGMEAHPAGCEPRALPWPLGPPVGAARGSPDAQMRTGVGASSLRLQTRTSAEPSQAGGNARPPTRTGAVWAHRPILCPAGHMPRGAGAAFTLTEAPLPTASGRSPGPALPRTLASPRGTLALGAGVWPWPPRRTRWAAGQSPHACMTCFGSQAPGGEWPPLRTVLSLV